MNKKFHIAFFSITHTQPTICTRDACLGSVMSYGLASSEPRKPDAILKDAKDFLEQYFTSIRR